MRLLLKVSLIATSILAVPSVGAFAGERNSPHQRAQEQGEADAAHGKGRKHDIIRLGAGSNKGEDHYINQFCDKPWCPWQPR